MTTETSSLGEFLRYEREHRGMTIEQVASATKIGVRTLHSLESDHYADLPAVPFIRGFVISYCRFIGLDAKEVLATYADFINKKSIERPNRESGHSGYAFEKRDGEQQSRTFLFIAIFGFVVVGGVAVLFLKPSLSHRRASHIERLKAAHPVPGPSSLEATALSSTANPAASGLPIPGGASSTTASTSTDLAIHATNPGASTPQNSNPNQSTGQGTSLASVTVAQPSPSPKPVAAAEPPRGVTPVTPSPASVTVAEATKSAPSEAAPGAETEQKPGANPDDLLDSGHNLPMAEVHQRIVFKVLEDIWVRYQVDQRPMRKFIIRKGKSLVLKAKDRVAVQVSQPDAVQFSYNGLGFKLVNDSKDLVDRQGEATLFFPPKLASGVEKPFKESRPLPKIVPMKAQTADSGTADSL